MSVLSQNQNEFDDKTVIETVLLGHKRLVEIMHEKDALYAKPDFSDEDGIRAGELENEFLELNGWDAEPEAQNLLGELGVPQDIFYTLMQDVEPKSRSKCCLLRRCL